MQPFLLPRCHFSRGDDGRVEAGMAASKQDRAVTNTVTAAVIIAVIAAVIVVGAVAVAVLVVVVVAVIVVVVVVVVVVIVGVVVVEVIVVVMVVVVEVVALVVVVAVTKRFPKGSCVRGQRKLHLGRVAGFRFHPTVLFLFSNRRVSNNSNKDVPRCQ